MSDQVYPTVDPAELEPEYSEHLRAIGAEHDAFDGQEVGSSELYAMTRFAAIQLALRDREIARLNQELDDYDICRGSVLRKNLESERDAALARVRELEEALHRQERLTIEANESLDRYIESEQELRARILELTEWRPIESAPYTTVLVLAKAGHVVALHHKPGDRWEGDWTSDELIGWLPLPEVPRG